MSELLQARLQETAQAVIDEWESDSDDGTKAVVRLGVAISRLRLALRATAGEGLDYKALYYELLFQVGQKYPNESRHETALRYLRQAEAHGGGPVLASPRSEEETTKE